LLRMAAARHGAVHHRCACCARWLSTPPASSSASACCWRWRRRQRGVQCLRCTPRWDFFRAQGRRACSVSDSCAAWPVRSYPRVGGGTGTHRVRLSIGPLSHFTHSVAQIALITNELADPGRPIPLRPIPLRPIPVSRSRLADPT
jgi:hypothetical protein